MDSLLESKTEFSRELRKMSVPPKYDDLGKESRDVFGKGYGFGSVKLDLKTKTKNNVEFITSGSSNNDTGKVFGSLETKYKYADYGVTLAEKWTTDNFLTSQITVEDQIAKGLKLEFDTSFAPNTGKKSAKIKSAYKQDYFHGTGDVDFDFAGPTVQASAVVGYEGWVAGYQAAYDTAKSKLIGNNFSFGYRGGDFHIHSSVNDASRFTGSIYHKLSSNLEAAAELNWASSSSSTSFQVGCKYDVDKDASFRAKVNNNSQVGAAYTQRLRDGIKLTLSSLIDTKNLNQGGHKIGLGLDMEA
ncbi:Voltage-dependent anion-selective channel protein 2 [Stylophora pistillata]|uniref:Voltage-dependent anion-selective channel protein 2 n=3 Tax=Stylophora pistillata TaxID=50429 RepID=A0A2B4RHR9_STYPI|nr:Voltage-dependent anion-selective channel protein 2 [Stylophora pistillata]